MQAEKRVGRLFDAVIQFNRFQPSELLRWLVADVLASFGVKPTDPPPDDAHEWLLQQSAEYARMVAADPFGDILGSLYQMLASRSRRDNLGQFFTPGVVSSFLNAMVVHDIPTLAPEESPRLLRMCEPSCGSGALVLGFLRQLIAQQGREAPGRWSIAAVDLDSLCAQMCAAQVLANLLVSQVRLGELVVYHGNALGPVSDLRVVVHALSPELGRGLALPALHPSRVELLRQRASQTCIDAKGNGQTAAPSDRPPVSERAVAVSSDQKAEPVQADLFG